MEIRKLVGSLLGIENHAAPFTILTAAQLVDVTVTASVVTAVVT